MLLGHTKDSKSAPLEFSFFIYEAILRQYNSFHSMAGGGGGTWSTGIQTYLALKPNAFIVWPWHIP